MATQIEVFAELFSKSDRLPSPDNPHKINFLYKKTPTFENSHLILLFIYDTL